jgi:nucleotide-binding universal stress UspA family protein
MQAVRYRNLLVAFDGSPASELALAHAVAIAHVHRAKLALVAVVPPRQLVRVPRADDGELEPALLAAANAVPDDLQPTARLLEGDPAREILRAARDHDAILMGAGRVAAQVVEDAEVPVIVIHRPDGPDLAA